MNINIENSLRRGKNLVKSGNFADAEKLYEKSVMDLSKAVSKVDKTHSKTISGLWKDISNSLKQFKDLLSKEVLDKLQ